MFTLFAPHNSIVEKLSHRETENFSKVTQLGRQAQLRLEPMPEGSQCLRYYLPHSPTTRMFSFRLQGLWDMSYGICRPWASIVSVSRIFFPDRSRIDSSQGKGRGHPPDSQCKLWPLRRGPTWWWKWSLSKWVVRLFGCFLDLGYITPCAQI